MTADSARQEVLYNKNTPLESVFRNAIARILDFMIVNQRFDYSPAEVSKLTGIPLRTVQRAIPHLVNKGLIKENRPIGNTTMYILNSDHPLTKVLKQYLQTAIDLDIEATARHKGQKPRLS